MVTALTFLFTESFRSIQWSNSCSYASSVEQWIEAMRNLLDYLLVLTVRLGAGSALVMVKNLWP